LSLTRKDAARLGGSDLSSILGLSPWGTPLTVYARVVSALEGRSLQDKDDSQKRRGRHLEGAVLALYEEETGATVLDSPKLTHPRLPFGRASLDALANRNGRRVVEVKTAGMSELRQWGEAGTDQIPQGYVFQTQWYAGVAKACGQTDVDDVDVAALVGGDLRLYVVPFDGELFGLLEQALERFWVDHVLARRPPPVAEPLRDVDAIGVLYPRHSGNERHWETYASEEQRAILAYLGSRAARIAAQREEAAAEAALKLILKDTPKVYGLPPGSGAKALSWKQSKQGHATDWKMLAEELAETFNVRGEDYARLVREHTTTKEGARPLRVTALKEEE
jgi:putative phage-type endonuclease